METVFYFTVSHRGSISECQHLCFLNAYEPHTSRGSRTAQIGVVPASRISGQSCRSSRRRRFRNLFPPAGGEKLRVAVSRQDKHPQRLFFLCGLSSKFDYSAGVSGTTEDAGSRYGAGAERRPDDDAGAGDSGLHRAFFAGAAQCRQSPQQPFPGWLSFRRRRAAAADAAATSANRTQSNILITRYRSRRKRQMLRSTRHSTASTRCLLFSGLNRIPAGSWPPPRCTEYTAV